ncbi:19081_t:CDS:1, partial [Cetraspora pellucida]
RINNTGVKQQRSTLMHKDSTGVNDRSKNTTLMNYIPDALNHDVKYLVN